MRSERRILLGGVGLAGVVLVGVGWLVVHALAGASAAEADRHRAVAERLFDELEGELSAIVAREESRSFLEYRYFYVPEDNAYDPALVLSELSRVPDDPSIVGWFQVDPGNVVSTPLVPRDNEVRLANATGSWTGDPAAVGVQNEITQVLAALPGWSEPARPEPKLVERPTQVAVMPVPMPGSSLLLNRGSSKRSDRQAQVVSTKQVNIESFNTNDEPVDNLVQQQRAAPPQLNPDVDVVVSPISGLRRDNHLVLHRIVKTNEGVEHRQGVVLRIDALVEKLERTALDGSELRPYVHLAWDGAPALALPYRYDHRFAEPFTSLRVMASMDRVPALIGREASTVRWLAGVVLVAILGGGLGLYRAVRTQLEYARRRSDFVAAVSHELKTPLTTIRMYAEMLRDGMVPTSERQRAYHHTITMESDRLGRLIANVLELARLERGGARPVEVVGAVEPVLREAVDIVRPHAERAGFTIRIHAAPDLPPARIDRDALVQIVVNLVDNAVKFAVDGERNIELTLTAAGERVLLRVRDHGPGVPRSHLRKVFDPFWRGERELTRKTRGTGIGLALVRGLAEQMGGRVTAGNHPDGGFQVSVLLS